MTELLLCKTFPGTGRALMFSPMLVVLPAPRAQSSDEHEYRNEHLSRGYCKFNNFHLQQWDTNVLWIQQVCQRFSIEGC